MSKRTPSQSACVLYVENDPNDLILFGVAHRQLECNFDLHTVSSVGAAKDFYLGRGKYCDRRLFPAPSLIVLDYGLTGETGVALLRWLRKGPPASKLPVVVFSGGETSEKVLECYEAGADYFVHKTQRFTRLLEFVACINQCMSCKPPSLDLLRTFDHAVLREQHVHRGGTRRGDKPNRSGSIGNAKA